MAQPTPLKLTVKTREEIIYQGQVKSLTSVNEVGRFDILPQHANFISLVNSRLVIKDVNNSEQTIPIDVAVLKASENEIKVFLGVKSLLPREGAG